MVIMQHLRVGFKVTRIAHLHRLTVSTVNEETNYISIITIKPLCYHDLLKLLKGIHIIL